MINVDYVAAYRSKSLPQAHLIIFDFLKSYK